MPDFIEQRGGAGLSANPESRAGPEVTRQQSPAHHAGEDQASPSPSKMAISYRSALHAEMGSSEAVMKAI